VLARALPTNKYGLEQYERSVSKGDLFALCRTKIVETPSDNYQLLPSKTLSGVHFWAGKKHPDPHHQGMGQCHRQ
jgi:hypothetical protein